MHCLQAWLRSGQISERDNGGHPFIGGWSAQGELSQLGDARLIEEGLQAGSGRIFGERLGQEIEACRLRGGVLLAPNGGQDRWNVVTSLVAESLIQTRPHTGIALRLRSKPSNCVPAFPVASMALNAQAAAFRTAASWSETSVRRKALGSPWACARASTAATRRSEATVGDRK